MTGLLGGEQAWRRATPPRRILPFWEQEQFFGAGAIPWGH